MKFHYLRNVVTIAEQGSLHAAARHLKIAQPALTRSIRELERELGAPLFERSARGVVATEIGERFIRRARAVLSELNLARDEVAQYRGSAGGRITVCLGVLPYLTLLPLALTAFRARYPDVYIEIIEARFPAVEARVRSGIVDFFVGPLFAMPGKEFTVERLYEQQVGVLCRKGHPLAGARSLRDLTGAEWLTNSVTVEPAEEVGPLFARHGLPPPRLIAQSHSGLTILTTIACSDLVVLLPVDLADSSLGSMLLQRINIAEAVPDHPIDMIHRAALPLTPAAEYCADMFRRASAEYARSRRAASEAQCGGASHRKLAASSTLPRPR